MKAKYIYHAILLASLFWIFCAIVVDQDIDRAILTELQDSEETLQAPDTIIVTDTVVYTAEGKIIDSNVVYVRNMLDSLGVRFAHIVTAQMIEETGWLSCEGCSLDHNNLFGFRYKKKYLVFDSWLDCCIYYRDWQNRHYRAGQDYYEFLKCVQQHTDGECMPYASEPNYIKYVKSIVEQL